MNTFPSVTPVDVSQSVNTGVVAAASFGELVQRIVQSNSGKHKALVPSPGSKLRDDWEHYCRSAEEASLASNFARTEGMLLKAIAEAYRFEPSDWRCSYSLDRLASLYFAQGRFDEAEVFAIRALESMTTCYGYESEKTADCEDFVASIYFNLGRLDEAAAHGRQAATLFEKVRGDHDPRLASVYYNLGVIYHSCGSFEQAETFYQRAYQIRCLVFGAEHDATTKISKSYGELVLDRKCHEEARQIIDRLIGPALD